MLIRLSGCDVCFANSVDILISRSNEKGSVSKKY